MLTLCTHISVDSQQTCAVHIGCSERCPRPIVTGLLTAIDVISDSLPLLTDDV